MKKTRKIKASSALAAFIFGVSLLLLCSFGTDAAYVVLSRYKLQKITEYIAMEFASSKARDSDNTIKTEQEETDRANIRTKYEAIYNRIGSGIIVFNITNMDYKADRQNEEVVVKVKTTSKVMPAFLRFTGVKEILVHSTAYAKTNRVEIDKTITADQDFGSTTNYSDWEKSRAVFDFTDDSTDGCAQYAEGISAKNTGIGDFMIQFGYESRASWWGTSDIDLDSGGGFFVIAGVKYDLSADDMDGWVDIGNKATNKSDSDLKRVCVNGDDWALYEETNEYDSSTQCYYCVNAAEEGTIVFDLSKDISGTTDTGGRIKKINNIWVLKAGGSGEQQSDGTYLNPCDPTFTQSDSGGSFYGPFAKYFRRNAIVRLTILNNVTVINKKTYDDFSPLAKGINDTDIKGCWSTTGTICKD